MARQIKEFVSNATLLRCANLYRKAIVKRAPTSRIKRNVRISGIYGQRKNKYVQIVVKAPEARAYEYGSGLHAKLRKKAKYIIRARRRRALYFYWEKIQETFVAPYVWHPGVAAKPYIAPARKEVRREIANIVKQESKQKIKLHLVNEFNKMFRTAFKS